MEDKWQITGLRRAAAIALAMGVVVVCVSACEQFRSEPKSFQPLIKSECSEASSPLCGEYFKTIQALDLLRITYLESTNACGKNVACSKGIRPNVVGPTEVGRVIGFAFDQCSQRCELKHPENKDRQAQCMRDECGIQ